MADNDQNQSSNKSTPNQLTEHGLSDIERIGRRASSRSAEDRAERQRIDQARTTIEGLEELIEMRPEAVNSKDIMKGLSNARATRNRLGPRIRLRREARVDRALEETRNAIEREFSSRTVNGQVSSLMGTEAVQRGALGMMNMDYSVIEEQRSSIMSNIGGLEQNAIDIAGSMYDREGRMRPESLQKLQSIYKQKGSMVKKLSSIAAVERQKKMLGEDPESQMDNLLVTGKRAEDILVKRQALNERAAGSGLGAVSVDDLRQKEAQHANELVKALEELKNSAGKTAEEIDKLKTEAGTAADNLKKTQTALDAASSAGGGGGGGGAFLRGIGGVLSPIAQAAAQIGINQPMQVRQNAIGFANLTNQAFDMRKGAISGNMADLSLMSSGAFDAAAKEGKFFANVSRGVTGVQVTTGVAQAALGAVQTANAAKNVVGTLGLLGSEAAMQGIGQTASGAAQAAVGVSDLAQGATAGSVNLQFQQTNLALDKERMHVTSAMRQQFYDYSMGMRSAALAGGGSVGENILAGFSDPNQLKKMEDARIGTEQFAQLASQGAAAQGSMFSTDQIYTARNLEKAGLGDMSTNMTRISQLASVGVNNPQNSMQAVLEAAFSKSLDSSKALNMMVENTTAMAQRSSGAQLQTFDTTGVSAGIISNLVKEDAPNKEMALQRAANVAELFNNINTGVGSNFSDMAGIAAIAKGAKVSDVTAINLKKMDNATAAAIQEEARKVKSSNSAGEEQDFARKLAESHGLAELTTRDKQGNMRVDYNKLNAALQERSKSIFRTGEFMAIVNKSTPGADKLLSGEMSLKELHQNPELYEQVSKFVGNKGITMEEFFARGIPGDTSKGKGKAADATSGKTTSETAAALDDLATAKFKEMTKEARLAAEQLGGVTNALKAIRSATENLSNKLDDKTAEEFRNAAAVAAKNFESGASKFTTSVGNFGIIVDKLAERNNVVLPPPPPEPSEKR